jgi:hypothetical protein
MWFKYEVNLAHKYVRINIHTYTKKQSHQRTGARKHPRLGMPRAHTRPRLLREGAPT